MSPQRGKLLRARCLPQRLKASDANGRLTGDFPASFSQFEEQGWMHRTARVRCRRDAWALGCFRAALLQGAGREKRPCPRVGTTSIVCWMRIVCSMRMAAPENRCGHSHGQRPEVPPAKAYIAWSEFSDNASRRKLPTSLLNHETSDHLLSRCWAKEHRFRGWDFRSSWARFPGPSVLSIFVSDSASHNKSCIRFFCGHYDDFGQFSPAWRSISTHRSGHRWVRP